jgi:hypothetical protein
LRLDLSFFRRPEFVKNPIYVKERRKDDVLVGISVRELYRDSTGRVHHVLDALRQRGWK